MPQYTRPRRRSYSLSHAKKQIRNLKLLTVLASFFLLFLFFISISALAVFAYFAKDLPSPKRLSQREVAQSTKIYDRYGKLLYDVYGEENRTLVTLDEVSPYVIQATLATEDADFYRHKGFDPLSIIRAIYNISRGRGLQGGSTISQQLVKNTLLTPERTLTRKLKEFVLAIQIEKKYNKDEILQMYLNEAPYGGTAWGIEAASQMFFGKNAKELNLAEAALLAGLPQKPSVYSPFGSNPERATERQQYVLHLMRDRGWLTKNGQRQYLAKEKVEEAKLTKLEFKGSGERFKAPHFVMYVKSILAEHYGEKIVQQGGLRVTTTLDLDKQELMQQIVTEEIEKAKGLQVGNGALIVLDSQTGEILAMVGSKDYFAEDYEGKVNVVLSQRQPGSAIKPITYTAAFKKGYTAASLVMDVATAFPGGIGQPDYKPINYDGKFRGPLSFRYALGNSINLAAVKVLQLITIPEMLNTAHQLGITTLNEPERYGLSLTLGGGEVKLVDLTTVYATFANQGYHNGPVAILEVKDAKGKILERFQPSSGKKVLDEGYAYLMSDILSDNAARTLAFGPYSQLVIPKHTVAVKTGTTNDIRDNWTLGYTPSVTIGVWVGNNDNSAMHPRLASGITGAAPIWHRAMVEWLKDKPDEPFIRPDNIIEAEIDALSGLVPLDGCPRKREIFVKGTEPTEPCDVHKKMQICKIDGKIASDVCIKRGYSEEKVFIKFTEPINAWQSFTDQWVNENYGDDPVYHPPTEVSQLYLNPNGKDEPIISFLTPGESDVVERSFTVKIDVLTPFTVTKVQFYLDGAPIDRSLTSVPYEKTFSLTKEMTGKRRIGVKAYDSAGSVGESEIGVTVK